MKVDGEAQSDRPKRGGWITSPFIIATSACLTMGNSGWLINLIVYLIGEFNVKSINAAQVFNIVNGGTSFFSLLGAIMADSFLGCFSTVWISSLISLLGTILLTLTAAVDSLRPQPCESVSISCPTPSKLQYAVLYAGLALAALGLGSGRFTLATMGANQFPTTKERGIYFNWYFVSFFVAGIIGSTAIIYVEDNVSWALGLGLCATANALGLAIFLFGNRFYQHVRPQGNPFTSLVQVFVASLRKRKVAISTEREDYYCGPEFGAEKVVAAPTESFRFLNRAAIRIEGDTKPDGSIAKPWKLCTLQQVEDLKTLIRIFPLWSSSIFLATPIGVQTSLLVLQALTMDRHLGPHFKIPAGSMLIFGAASTCIALVLSDRYTRSTWKKLIGQPPTPLQLVGVGHVLTVAGMAVSAVVESRRRSSATVPISVFWLVPQLAIVGIGEAFHFPGQVVLYYQEFPASLKSMATAMIGLLVGISYYLSTAVIGCVRRVTGWLPNDINDGKVDYVFWMLVVVGGLNFGYFLLCAVLYKYGNLERAAEGGSD